MSRSTSEHSFSAIQRLLGESVYTCWALCASSGAIVASNRGLSRCLRTPTSEIVGRLLWDLLTEADAARFRQTIASGDVSPDRFLLNFVDWRHSVITLSCAVELRTDSFLIVGEEPFDLTGNERLIELNNELAVLSRENRRKSAALDLVGEQLRRQSAELAARLDTRERDIRELEQQRSASQQYIATGRIAAGIAHEINNPLAGIKNSLLLIGDAFPADHPYYSYMGRIKSEVDRIASIVRHLYDLYRLEPEEPRTVRLPDTIHDVIALLEPKLRAHRVTAELKHVGCEDAVTVPDASLRQILYSAVVNAAEASPPGGAIRISCELTAGIVVIRVADEGPGIPEAVRPRVFEPFFTTKAHSGGLGLGLTAARTVAESIGGSISFEANSPVGTIFTLRVPQNRAASARATVLQSDIG